MAGGESWLERARAAAAQGMSPWWVPTAWSLLLRRLSAARLGHLCAPAGRLCPLLLWCAALLPSPSKLRRALVSVSLRAPDPEGRGDSARGGPASDSANSWEGEGVLGWSKCMVKRTQGNPVRTLAVLVPYSPASVRQ